MPSNIEGLKTKLARQEALLTQYRRRQRTTVLYPLLDHQIPIFRNETKNIVLAKGRRAGGTQGSAGFAIEHAAPPCSQHGLWVDFSYRAIHRYVRKYFLPFLLKNFHPSTYSWNQNLMLLSFAHGGSIEFGSADKPELLEGAGYDFFIINEAGILLRNEDLYFNTLLPMGMERGGAQWVFNGTPKGRGLFQRLYARGEDREEPDWASFHITAYDNPTMDKKVIDRIGRTFPEFVYKQEMLGQFVSDGGDFFQQIEEAVEGEDEERPIQGILYVMGVDVAKSLDYTVVWVFRTDQRKAIYCRRFNRRPWKETSQIIGAISKQYNNARIIYDSTGVGDALVDDIAASGGSISHNDCIVFTNLIKNELLNRLSADLEYGRVKLYNHKETINELRVFERKMLPSGAWRLEAPKGAHDDCVIALALGNFALGVPGLGYILTTDNIAAKFDEFDL